MKNKYFNYIKDFPLINLLNSRDGWTKNLLKILGVVACIGTAGFAGFAINGLLGGSFGLVLGYVAGKLVVL